MVLPEPEFADDAERLSGPHRGIDAVHRLDMADDLAEEAALDRKPDFEALGLHDDRRARVGLGRRALGLGRKQHLRIGMLGIVEDLRASRPASTILPCCMTQT